MKKKVALFLLIFLGTLFQLITVFRSGLSCSRGICFWGPNGHDGIWHLALNEQTAKQVPPLVPGFSGEKLENYHWGYNLLSGFLVKVLGIPNPTVHFRILPITFSLLLGILSYLLVSRLEKSFWAGFWFAFLNYFSSSLGWVITFLRSGKLGGESLFWMMQSASFLLNPPYALSIVLLLLGIFLFLSWKDKMNFLKIVILGLIFGSLLNVKAYASILFLLSLSCAIGIIFLLKKEIDKNILLVFSFSFSFAFLLWFLFQRGSDFPFIFNPFWFIRTMFEAKDRLYIPRLGLVWWGLVENWLTSPRFWLLVGFGFFIFILGNFSTRLIGFLKIKKRFWDIFFLGFIFWGILIPMFFVQKGTAWNTIQFGYYSLFWSNFFFARILTFLTKKRSFLLILLCLLPLLPSNREVSATYLTSNPSSYIPQEEVVALEFLKNQEGNIVLTYPYESSLKANREPPYPMYLYETTAYVSAFSGKQTFLEDEMNLTITGYKWEDRLKQVKSFFETQDIPLARGILVNNGIDYIYLVNDQEFMLQEGDLGLKMIFNNGQVRIYKVQR